MALAIPGFFPILQMLYRELTVLIQIYREVKLLAHFGRLQKYEAGQ